MPTGPRAFLPLYVLVLATLLAQSTPRRIGDADEYIAVAASLSRFERPALKRADREKYGVSFRQLTGADGRQDMLHFWIYPAAAAMPLRLAVRLGGDPAEAFAAVNVALLLGAAVVARRRLHWTSLWLLFAGPVIWWADKVHTEVFTFSLVTIAVCAFPAAPVAASVAAGVAAAQNPPLALVLILGALGGLAAGTAWRRVALGVAVGALLAAVHPLYYWIRLGRLAPLADAASAPLSFASFSAVLLDPNVGLVFNDPWLPLAAAITVGYGLRQRTWRPTAWHGVSVATGLLLLVVFGRVINLNHGGTPSMSRYALWLMPLSVPFLPQRDSPRWSRFARAVLAVVAVAGTAASIATYRPSLEEHFVTPTRLARWLWTQHPAIDNPLPEIFAERLLHRENAPPPGAATDNCAKVLTWYGEAPPACPVGPVAPECAEGSCYANRRGDGTYRFVVAPRRR